MTYYLGKDSLVEVSHVDPARESFKKSELGRKSTVTAACHCNLVSNHCASVDKNILVVEEGLAVTDNLGVEVGNHSGASNDEILHRLKDPLLALPR